MRKIRRPLVDAGVVHETRAQARALAELSGPMIESVPVGIVAYSADGACIMANPAFGRAVRCLQDELLRQNFRGLPWWRQTGLLDVAEATLADGLHRECEVMF